MTSEDYFRTLALSKESCFQSHWHDISDSNNKMLGNDWTGNVQMHGFFPYAIDK